MTEAVLGILMLAGVLLLMVDTDKVQQREDEYINDLILDILDDIAENESLRVRVLAQGDNDLTLDNMVNGSLPNGLNFSMEVCDLASKDCSDSHPVKIIPTNKNLYTEERIISSTISTYDPKIFRLYVWQ